MNKKVIVIVGPTAVGKTSLSIKIAHNFSGEIISGDSMQIYRNLDIGTAKVSIKEMENVKHHLINICDINDRFTAYDFQSLALLEIERISHRNHLPIVVGGTGFYLNSLIYNLFLGGDCNSNKTLLIRNKLLNIYQDKGKTFLWNLLYKLDPNSADNISMNNIRKVIRALEVIYITGRPFSQQPKKKDTNISFLILGLNTNRKILYKRINRRVDLMIKNGLIDEAFSLYKHRKTAIQASKGIGYKELFDYFDNKCSLNKSIDNIKRNSRRYAKRQLTWFKNKMKNVYWFDPIQNNNDISIILQLICEWISS